MGDEDEFIASRRFSEADQREFVSMSGDENPIHADAVAATQMFTGGIIIHGVHGIMWSLDAYLADRQGYAVRSIQARFLKPIRLDEDVKAFASRAEGGLKIKLVSRDVTFTIAKIVFGNVQRVVDVADAPVRATPLGRPPMRRLDELPGVAGTLTMPAYSTALAGKFPHLAAAIGSTAVIGLGSLATLVGMECPGLYGVSTDIAVDFSTEAGALTYAVRRVDRRFSRAEIDVRGYGLGGKVGAFVNEPKAAR